MHARLLLLYNIYIEEKGESLFFWLCHLRSISFRSVIISRGLDHFYGSARQRFGKCAFNQSIVCPAAGWYEKAQTFNLTNPSRIGRRLTVPLLHSRVK